MTRTHYDDMSLEGLVRESEAIFCGTLADPPTRVELISILPEGSEFEGSNVEPFYEPPYHDRDPGPHRDKNYPPYRQVWHRLVVEEVLRGDGAEPGDVVEVCEGATGRHLDLHRMYYLEGKRKSPIYRAYRSAEQLPDASDDPGRILFAVKGEGGAWHMPVMWAMESPAKREQVATLIKDNPGGPGLRELFRSE
jgi:hypothetical protein